MQRYKNGKIYKLVNNFDEKIYIGSTCLLLTKRLYQHKLDAKRKAYTVYKYLNEIGWDTEEIILIEKYPCDEKVQLLSRERYWIDKLEPELNKIKRVGLYLQLGRKEFDSQRHKEKYKENKVEILARNRKYRDEHPDYHKQYYESHKEEKKEQKAAEAKKYIAQNREKIAAQKREYYERTRDHQLEKITCECGGKYARSNKSGHFRTKKHRAQLASQLDSSDSESDSETTDDD